MAEELQQQAVAVWKKALANKANNQCHLEVAECATALATKALTKEQHCQESVERPVASVEKALSKEQRCREAADWATALAETALSKEQRY
jgi:hypothetical protein